MIKIGIVGHGADKFTQKSALEAKKIISSILVPHAGNVTLISGHSPVGGIDIWAEDCARLNQFPMELKVPKQHKWDAEYGFKQRNEDIAKESDEVHIILVNKYPPEYYGMRFAMCYHCKKSDHVKSGGCWTGKVAERLGKKVIWHIINND